MNPRQKLETTTGQTTVKQQFQIQMNDVLAKATVLSSAL